ncbi:hypothetical protein Lepto7376_2655 [[Leptolyngbya] sp. PCC 7376]|uniref:hypothetical protein n=1 Tax=[Leptolyngbya] sp. PCC 7376 TaxID=111781 RepID=UPI00029F00EE|nr:hypothetical protein [[Leptolyngbya] sp. PCC 7376]AFY38926.1 hypothetical protein Lepto7376_2655 [[Leptolyngbya] sp. PCC 7376]
MPANTCIISNNSEQKAKLAQCFERNALLSTSFPRNLQNIFELAQQSPLLLIVIALKQDPTLSKKICHSLKKNPLTKNTPLILIKKQGLSEDQQLADAYLPDDFSMRDLEQLVRQLTIGY